MADFETLGNTNYTGDFGTDWNNFTSGVRNGWNQFWDALNGVQNTRMQNSAAAALQLEAQRFNASESAAQRAFESAEAEKARIWQEMMSNTSYQRAVKDLQAAGLNPWLAVGNGASDGSAVAASGSAASSGMSTAQASNVNMLASLGTAAAGIGILVKALKYVAK